MKKNKFLIFLAFTLSSSCIASWEDIKGYTKSYLLGVGQVILPAAVMYGVYRGIDTYGTHIVSDNANRAIAGTAFIFSFGLLNKLVATKIEPLIEEEFTARKQTQTTYNVHAFRFLGITSCAAYLLAKEL